MQHMSDILDFRGSDWTKKIPKGCFIERDNTLQALCAGKSVLHVGAADAPFDLDKGLRGELLHQKIRQVAQFVIGVDVNPDAVASLRKIGIDDIIVGDICDPDVLQDKKFDLVLCADVIEHVAAPGSLIAACRRCMADDGLLVVSTINATAIKPALRALLGRESVHFDH